MSGSSVVSRDKPCLAGTRDHSPPPPFNHSDLIYQTKPRRTATPHTGDGLKFWKGQGRGRSRVTLCAFAPLAAKKRSLATGWFTKVSHILFLHRRCMKQKSHVLFSLNCSTFCGIFRYVYQFFTSHVTVEQITKWQTLTVLRRGQFYHFSTLRKIQEHFATRDVPIETR